MRTKRKISKKAIALTLAVSTMAGSFATAYAADYNFTIVRGIVDGGKDDQVWKNQDSLFGSATVKEASAPSYYTTYMFYSYDDLISDTPEIQNKPGKSVDIKYQYGARGNGFLMHIRGCDNRGTAPNYSTVSGTYNPVK